MSILPGKISDFLKIAVAAAGRGDLQTVQAVLAQKPAWITPHRLAWPHHAVGKLRTGGRLAMVDYLLDQGADIHACGCPLHAAASRNLSLLRRALQAPPRSRRPPANTRCSDRYLHRSLPRRKRCSRRTTSTAKPELATAEKAQHDSSQRMNGFCTTPSAPDDTSPSSRCC